jgi:hypothetical protein
VRTAKKALRLLHRSGCFAAAAKKTPLVRATRKAACTHTGFLPESDPDPVVEFFTLTGITDAGGQHR